MSFAKFLATASDVMCVIGTFAFWCFESIQRSEEEKEAAKRFAERQEEDLKKRNTRYVHVYHHGKK